MYQISYIIIFIFFNLLDYILSLFILSFHINYEDILLFNHKI